MRDQIEAAFVIEKTQIEELVFDIDDQFEVSFEDGERSEEKSGVFVDTQLYHERNQKGDSLFEFICLRIFFVQYFMKFLLPKSAVVQYFGLGI